MKLSTCAMFGSLFALGCGSAQSAVAPPAAVEIAEPQLADRAVSVSDVVTGALDLEVRNETPRRLSVRLRGGGSRGIVEPGQTRVFGDIPSGVWVAFEARDDDRGLMATVPPQVLQPRTRFRWVVTADAIKYPIPR